MSISTDNATVVIQINPQVEENRVSEDEKKTGGIYHNTTLKNFLKVQPKSLGIVQIMIGLMTFLMGIVLTISLRGPAFDALFVIFRVTYWGSLIYISTGSLSVAAENKLNPCVVKASLGMNVFSAISAGIATILMFIDVLFHDCYIHRYSNDFSNCLKFKGVIVILLVFSILQFIISICISAFACKATCNRPSTVVNVKLNTAH